ncbi:hypothetical protein [Microbacterium sp. UBA3394]|uniref:hypothetical protein n=1 Tax=Microbacterium sp. UBA3394 TaxID=1946945 RepID=UPI0008DA050D|nr:hypothetical protein [Microbacterium sp. UBA3394]MAM54881.1 hypothetical protein [Microbacterium sp.]|tara:strand:+ start:168 stop:347 length:180 start_codon:yes stop_codon:yes gene_type:complete
MSGKKIVGLREKRVTRIVWVMSAAVVTACVGWSVLAQVMVPDACAVDPPPANAQYLHCD